MTWNTCRFCDKTAHHDRLIKYGTRHYAHPDCYLDAGKTLDALPIWQLRQFPYFLLKERELLETAQELLIVAEILTTAKRRVT